MPAYWVARSKINDPVEYKKYTDLVPGIIAKYGGKVLARGGKFQIMEGPDKFQRFVVIEFPSFRAGRRLFHLEGIRRRGRVPPKRRGRGRDHHGRGRGGDEVDPTICVMVSLAGRRGPWIRADFGSPQLGLRRHGMT